MQRKIREKRKLNPKAEIRCVNKKIKLQPLCLFQRKPVQHSREFPKSRETTNPLEKA